MRTTPSHDAPAIRIESDTGWAWRGDERLDLTPKAFAVLRHLVEHPKHLVTKDDLLVAAWGDTVVSEAAITSCIRDLRKALDDSSRTPRYIETVHRRGFRFIGPVALSSRAPGLPPPDLPPASATFVGRDAELARLHSLFAAAAGGDRRLVFVTGEPGIGKTSLVEAFLAQLGGVDGLRIGRGQCVEQYGASEAYLPVLEALGRMGREPGGDALVRILKRYAPTWLMQLPALLSDGEVEAVQRRAHGTTRERMLREVIEALDALAAEAPFVLFLEDLHWCDSATVDLLALLARRPDAARLLILGTYRPADVVAAAHPLKPVKQELQMHGLCEELLLEFLNETAVGDYLAARFPRASFEPDFGRLLHENTAGNPLFLVNVIDDVIAQGHVREVDGAWELSVPIERVASGVPPSLSQMVEKQIERLTPRERVVLAVGSVAGAEFSAALSTVDGIDAHDGEQCCDALARRGQFIRRMGAAEWPDGTVAGRYGFIHAVYRNVLYARISVGHRVGLHLRVGARLEFAHGPRAVDIAGELAMHFEQGRDVERAVHYRRQAADAALRQYGFRESVNHSTRALELLRSWPESPERNQQELMIQTLLGAAVVATNGWAAPEVADAYARARELCAQIGVTPQLFPVLVGLCGFYLMRGELRIAREVSQQLMVHAEATDDTAGLLGAHNTTGMGLFYAGEFVAALGHFERARAVYDPERHSPNRQFSVDHDPNVSCLAHTALTLLMIGHLDRAAARMRECLDYARALDHPLSVAMAYNFGSTFFQVRREIEIVEELEEVRLEYARKHDFDVFLLLGEVYRGWVLAERGQAEEGLVRIQQGLVAYQAIGAELGRPTFLGMLAEVYTKVGRSDEALAAMEEALTLAARTGLHYCDGELRRQEGTLLLGFERTTLPAGTRRGGTPHEQGEWCLLEAIEIARRQQAKYLELRAAMPLCRLWQRQGKVEPARALLADVYEWFTEGFETPDLIEAKTLLAELGGASKGRRDRADEPARRRRRGE
jgi:DNA-binding winged helix-turn-helix (wHTH) protein/predicted ATPase